MSLLLRNRIMELCLSQGFLRMVWNNAMDSSSLLTEESSTRWRLYSAREAMKMMEDTCSKQWIHFLRSDLWPPTSTSKKLTSPNCRTVSWNNIEMMKIIFDAIILSVEAERFSVRAGLGNVYNEICRNVVSGRYFALPIQTQIITVHSLS